MVPVDLTKSTIVEDEFVHKIPYKHPNLEIRRPSVFGFALLCAVGFGCQSVTPFPANGLPENLQAKIPASPHTLDLSKFSGPPSSAEQIERGDVLDVTISAGLNEKEVATIPVRVDESGRIELPEIGPVQIGGLSLINAEQAIAQTSIQRGLYRRPNVTVVMKKQRSNRITVVGAVETPGTIELPRGNSFLMNAIVSAGGLAADAGTQVKIRQPSFSEDQNRWATNGQIHQASFRGNSQSPPAMRLVQLDLNKDPGANSTNPGKDYLSDGAVITVERRELDPVHVVGLVKRPGQYDYPANSELRLFGAVALAEGSASKVADKVFVIRRSPSGEFVTIEASLTEAKGNPAENLVIAPGDIISVEQSAATVALDIVNFIRLGVGTNLPLF
jgi:polysaccharide export outer membrane protein